MSDGGSEGSDRGSEGRRSKVARLVDDHDLEGLGDELEARWTATGDDHWSLRDLAAHVNRAVVRERLHEAGLTPTESAVERYAALVNDGDLGTGDRTTLRRRLEREGVDVDNLEQSVVTYQAVRSYLTEYRDAEYDRGESDRLAAVSTAVQKLRGRVVSVTESKLERLRDASDLALGEFRVMVDVRVLCTDCNTQHGIGDLLADGGCNCDGREE